MKDSVGQSEFKRWHAKHLIFTFCQENYKNSTCVYLRVHVEPEAHRPKRTSVKTCIRYGYGLIDVVS